MHSSTTLLTIAGLLASTSIAGWSASSNTNIALYWGMPGSHLSKAIKEGADFETGQDANGQLTGVATQENLSTYCSSKSCKPIFGLAINLFL